jgi:hypothetical protein
MLPSGLFEVMTVIPSGAPLPERNGAKRSAVEGQRGAVEGSRSFGMARFLFAKTARLPPVLKGVEMTCCEQEPRSGGVAKAQPLRRTLRGSQHLHFTERP